ncbi:unnamed protein product, partial [Bubo scandiacus]
NGKEKIKKNLGIQIRTGRDDSPVMVTGKRQTQGKEKNINLIQTLTTELADRWSQILMIPQNILSLAVTLGDCKKVMHSVFIS